MDLLVYKIKDLLNAEEDIIGHSVNCVGAFGAGVAGQIKNKWPEVYRAYATKYLDEGWKLGDVQIVMLEKVNKMVANLATQKGYGYPKDGKVFVSYEHLGEAVARLLHYAQWKGYSVALPKIGAGLAGGNWNIIEQIIYKAWQHYSMVNLKIYSL